MPKISLIFCFYAVFLFCSPVMLRSEIVSLSCDVDSEFGATDLLFDTSNLKVKYAFWPWSSESRWGNDFILWTGISSQQNYAAAFSFNRRSNELIIKLVSENDWKELKYGVTTSDDVSAIQCVQGF